MIEKIKIFCKLHANIIRRVHHTTHLAYLAMVAAHGPYYLAAGGLFILGALAWMLHLEGIE